MRISTVRARLTCWNIATISAVLVVFSFGVYGLSARVFRDALDTNLRSAVQVTELTLNHEVEEHGGREPGEASVREVLLTMHQTSFPRTAIAIWDGNRLVADKSGLKGRGAAEVLAAAGDRSGIRSFTASGVEYRVLAAEVRVASIPAKYLVIANESTEAIEAELTNLRRVLLLCVPSFVLLCASVGYLLARKSLQPVAAMAAAVERISSANLNERLPGTKPLDEFGRLAETFNSLLNRLERSFADQQRFMAEASHELRTPLSVALTAAQVTLQNPERDNAELREAFSLVEEQLRRLKRIVEDMFLLAQADAGACQLLVQPVYLTDVAHEALRAARILAQDKNIELQHANDGPDLEFEGDEGLLRQLFLILLDNAVKYTPHGGRVGVRLKNAELGYEIEVEDNGPGISQAEQSSVFDRFYRTDKARSRGNTGSGSGAGLGLAIAKWITELHGGSISVSSSPAGSTFRVWLPRSTEREDVVVSA